jgi:hypothetical protein
MPRAITFLHSIYVALCDNAEMKRYHCYAISLSYSVLPSSNSIAKTKIFVFIDWQKLLLFLYIYVVSSKKGFYYI